VIGSQLGEQEMRCNSRDWHLCWCLCCVARRGTSVYIRTATLMFV
jgi:hypothetical protein